VLSQICMERAKGTTKFSDRIIEFRTKIRTRDNKKIKRRFVLQCHAFHFVSYTEVVATKSAKRSYYDIPLKSVRLVLIKTLVGA
jgi:hypothetical protein